MKTFELHRDEDETGVSGTGVIAEGCAFSDGWCAMRWTNEPRTTTLFPSLDAVRHIHGHGGKTRIVWTGDAAGRGLRDCAQDHSENVPFASVGGLASRTILKAPEHVSEKDREAYLTGYRVMAVGLYGTDWAVREMGLGKAP